MQKGKEYKASNGKQYFMCPFTDMYITQGSDGAYSHKGTMANDVRGLKAGIKYPYYAPCDVKCIKVTDRSNGESRWQSLEPVIFANGREDYATFEICHDETCDCYVGQVVHQGQQLGNMGKKGGANGVHCHIEISQSKTNTFAKNKYGIYCFPNEYDTDDCYFVDDTNVMNYKTANWKTTDQVKPAEQPKTWVRGDYKLITAKYLRSSTNLGNNIIKVQNCTSSTRKILTSNKLTAKAMIKPNVAIHISKIIKIGNRIWGKFGNCYICLQNADSSANARRI